MPVDDDVVVVGGDGVLGAVVGSVDSIVVGSVDSVVVGTIVRSTFNNIPVTC
jgi:hypothetical protein